MVTIYSTGCPKCKVLKMKLEKKGIEYTECHDVEKMQEMGLKSLPVLEMDGELYTFEKAIKLINER